MARFPFKPGAGAKAIRNPIYWNRLYLQETQRRGSHGGYSKDAHLTATWLNVNTNLNFFLCGWFKPILDISHRLTTKESVSLNERLDTVIEYRDTIASSWDCVSQSNLNKFVTQIKRFFLLVFKLTTKYDLFDRGEKRLLDFSYDSKSKDFVLIYGDLSTDRHYFMGRPAVRMLDEIRRQYRRSLDMVSEDFAKKSTVQKKQAPARKKKVKRRSEPSATSRSKGVVEEIDESGAIRFKYADCRDRKSTVRNRMKLHLRVALQPCVKDGNFSALNDTIETILSHSLKLGEGGSARIPIEVEGRELLVFEIDR